MDTRRSLIIGISIIVAGLLVALAVTLKPVTGRFQVGGVPGHAYVIDTVSGQVWEDFAIPTQGSSDSQFKKPKPR